MAFGEWLKEARGEMAQETLAKRAGVSKGYITSLESNKRTPSVAVAIALAEALGRDPKEALAAMAGEKKLEPRKAGKKVSGEDELVEYFHEMPPKVRKLALEIAKRLAKGEGLNTGKYDE